MKVIAPAKINLSLRVIAKREDGYHEIETFMCPIPLADELTIDVDPGDAIEFTCSDPSLPLGDDNLVVRAARLYRAATSLPTSGLRIHLEKNIPHGAGLGGGSSDAAATLLALHELLPDTHVDLYDLAAQLGSDVPFFLVRSAAVCRGRGERVEPVATPHFHLLLLKPNFSVPTPWAYSRWEQSRELPGVPYAAQQIEGITLINDLERPVFEKFLTLASMKQWLLAQPELAAALMSGSGSTLFAILHSPSAAAEVATRAKSHFGSTLWTYHTP
jgi:4-diphosphocytidyl-2-C-methyl-D-erythritol kinase